jgi:FKBP-type peptidyl-prolyl cis-trans isomerase 2
MVRHLYKESLPIPDGYSGMKKSEKEKGRERVNAQKNQILMVVGGAVLALIVITVVGFLFFNPSGARTGDTVSVYYTGKLADGTVFDTNVGATPLVFTIGKGKIIPGFEEGVVGMMPNTTKTVQIPADKAYGPYKTELVHTVNRSTLPSDLSMVAGERYSVHRSDGAFAYVKVLNITPSTVTWDENHELAGKDLTFTITLEGISR